MSGDLPPVPAQAGPGRASFDVVFCLDVTGSMQPAIDALRESIIHVCRNFRTTNPQGGEMTADWRARVIAYRDLQAGEPLQESPFFENADDVAAWVQTLHADGGGDEPESTLDAIYKAVTETPWRDGVVGILIVFTDASPIPEMHPSTVGAGADRSPGALIHAYSANRRLRCWLYAPDHPVYREISVARNFRFTAVDKLGQTGQNVHDGLRNLNFDDLLKGIMKTATASGNTVVRFD